LPKSERKAAFSALRDELKAVFSESTDDELALAKKYYADLE
jgi:hypothetical protein